MAKRLAKRKRIQEPSRIQAILEKTLELPYSPYVAKDDPFNNNLFFDPDLEVALDYTNPGDAIRYFEETNISEFKKRIDVYSRLNANRFHTLPELASLITSFLEYLDENQEMLHKTGFPHKNFEQSGWLDWQLAPLYYVKFPVIVKCGELRVHHHWATVYLEPLNLEGSVFAKQKNDEDDEPDFFPIADYRFGLVPPNFKQKLKRDSQGNLIYTYVWSSLYGQVADEMPQTLFLFHRNDSSSHTPLIPCDYEEARYIPWLETGSARWLVSQREKVFQAKKQILEGFLRFFENRNADGFYERAFSVISQLWSGEELNRFLELDDLFFRNIPPQINPPTPGSISTGGIDPLLTIIAHFYMELRVGTSSKTKERMLTAMPADKWGFSYYHLIGKPWHKEIDRCLSDYEQYCHDEKEAWEDYREKIKVTFQEKFEYDVQTSSRWKRDKVDEAKTFLQRFVSWQEAHFRATGQFSPVGSSDREDPQPPFSKGGKPDYRQRTVIPFPTPKGTTWNQIRIEFRPNESARISAGGITKTLTFVEMGFSDGRKRNAPTPDSLWGLLKNGFGQHEGEISWSDRVLDTKVSNQLKSNVKELRIRLKALFDINDDPFHSYRSLKSYKTKFFVEDCSQE